MNLWSSLSTLFTLGRGVESISTSFDNIDRLNGLISLNDAQALLNNQLMQFNEGVLAQSGAQKAARIMKEGEAAMSAQMASLSARSAELAGSPELFIDETRSMQMTSVHEQFFQNEVDLINLQFQSADNQLASGMRKANLQREKIEERRSMWDMVFGVAKGLSHLSGVASEGANPFASVFGRGENS